MTRLGWINSGRQPHRPSSNGKTKKKFGTSPLRVHHHVHHTSEEVGALRSEVESLRAQVNVRLDNVRRRFSQNEHKAMAELLTRNAVLETEMEHYRIYLATSTSRYQKDKKRMMKTIQHLERQLQEAAGNE